MLGITAAFVLGAGRYAPELAAPPAVSGVVFLLLLKEIPANTAPAISAPATPEASAMKTGDSGWRDGGGGNGGGGKNG